MPVPTTTLSITEIFASIQGEAGHAGYPCAFVRLARCPLRCRWCDTDYSFGPGVRMEFSEIHAKLESFQIPLVQLTGGEPLAQPAVNGFARELIERGRKVLLETSGALSIKDVPSEVHIVMDLKAPASAMQERNLWANLELLKPTDEIKCVLADRSDFDWFVEVADRYDLWSRFLLWLSPVHGELPADRLAEWIIQSQRPLRLNLQQHKIIWSPDRKGV